MTWRRRAIGGLAALLTIALIAGCDASVPSATSSGSAVQRTPGAVAAAGAPPIVVIGATGDPATPYAWAEALAEDLDSGVLVTHEAESHTAYLTSSCVQRAVNEYLLGLTVPKAGLICQ